MLKGVDIYIKEDATEAVRLKAEADQLKELKIKVVMWLGKSLDDISNSSFALYVSGDLE